MAASSAQTPPQAAVATGGIPKRLHLIGVKRQPPTPVREPPEPARQADAPTEAKLPAAPAPEDPSYQGPRGIGLYPPPGTNPPKAGIVVPDDFELPPGYLRYFQTTDDGRSLQPILMFDPDYDFVDEQGNRVAIPEDGIVPPHMAPLGLPVEFLEVPKDYPPPAKEQLDELLRKVR